MKNYCSYRVGSPLFISRRITARLPKLTGSPPACTTVALHLQSLHHGVELADANPQHA